MIDRSVPPAGVVVGVDGDPSTLRAVGWAAREADRRHLPLDLVQVLPPSHRPDDELYAPTGRALSLLEQARRIAAVDAPDLTIRLSVVDGVAGPALVATAQRAHLLVLGSRALDGALDLTLGRTLVHAMSQGICPVIVVPPRWDPVEAHTGAVLVGVDGSPESHGAVAFATDVADRWRVRVTAVAVAPRREPDADGEARRRVIAEARAGMLERHPGVRLHETVAHGTPSEELLREARRGAALVVLGSRGRGALVGTLVGSTSQAVVRAAPCPVAVLPSRAAARWIAPETVWAEEGV
ncbi:universal stress protein [Actinomycetospora cinnamomea]|uniref:Nucleotide-binding universal stress UspA family protein n=1 Tax=Actinomycetospora cinnamomea TaxID=663609 RepID=A0A2U1F3R3_9PSEU|nr:universal stress protein [Actinomycetospora cinnamomea]PVZ06811.1 nucleotide-binding universal stress UspA family protein [Actinomycetospora cinnamomea]